MTIMLAERTRRTVAALVALTIACSLASSGCGSATTTKGSDSASEPASPTSAPLPGYFATGSLATAREAHSATLLPDGRVLVTGGWTGSTAVNSVEIYDPRTGGFAPAGTSTVQGSATLLQDGRVLIFGGSGDAELYDPKTGTVTPTKSPPAQHGGSYTTTLLQDGRVLIAGGTTCSQTGLCSFTGLSELYDPNTDTFSSTASMGRGEHEATLLSDGRVLITGWGDNPGEIYDPRTGTVTHTGPMIPAGPGGTATLLRDGRVLVVGGDPSLQDGANGTGAQLYDPKSGTFSTTGSMATPRYNDTATLLADGRVLVAGGIDPGTGSVLAVSELYDPATGAFSPAGSMLARREFHTATLLSDGRVLIVGGSDTTLSTGSGPVVSALAEAELYQPPVAEEATGVGPAAKAARWVAAGSLTEADGANMLVGLSDGRVLAVGLASLDCLPNVSEPNAAQVWENNSWTAAGQLNAARYKFIAQPLPGGGAIVAGGYTDRGVSYSSAKIWSPATRAWSQAPGLMIVARGSPASAALKDGRVLVAGGIYNDGSNTTSWATAEIFDPTTGTWASTGSLHKAQGSPQAVTLADGRVLLAGTWNGTGTVGDTEIWDPATGQWTDLGATPDASGFGLVALKDGSALLGGTSQASRFNPRSLAWEPAGSMTTSAVSRTAAVLGNGMVLVAGGLRPGQTLAATAAELYDPGTRKWTATVPMPMGRVGGGAVILADGSVLIAGGYGGRESAATTACSAIETQSALRYVAAVP